MNEYQQNPYSQTSVGQQPYQAQYSAPSAPYIQPQPTPSVPVAPSAITSAPDAPKKSGNKLVTTLIIILLVLTIANSAFIALMYFNGNNAQALDVQLEETKALNVYRKEVAAQCLRIENFRVREASGYSMEFVCDIENISSEDLVDVYVNFSYYDENGNFVGSSNRYFPLIEAKSTLKLDDYGFFLNAKRVEVSDIFASYASEIN